MVYIYEGHMGGLYYSDEYEEDTYCETCGDSDWLKGTASCAEDVYKLFENEINIDGSGGLDKEYLDEFVNSIDFD